MTEALLDHETLERSSVVAHRFMNRERELTGANGYGREVGFDVPAWLRGEGFVVDLRRRRVRLDGRRELTVPFAYRGADPRPGANYTGEPSVTSVYAR